MILAPARKTRSQEAIERADKLRLDGFGEFRSRVATNNDEVIEQRKRIVAYPLLELRGESSMDRDELTATQVLIAYVWKAMDVQEVLNCCIEVVKEAFDIAAEVDRKWFGSKQKPPLYGIPFSVKGSFYVSDLILLIKLTGYDCSIGLTKFLNQPKMVDCSLVAHFRILGGIPFVITNVPEALMSFVCSNTIYGTTLNPNDFSRSPGGSTGGGCALFTAGGTPFGSGKDLIGSLRVPAAFCGVVTLKLCQERLVVENTFPELLGRFHLGKGFGFYTHNVEEQIMLLKTIVGDPEYRKIVPASTPAPLDETKLACTDKLRLGYYEEDGFTPAVPGVKRCVLETVERLKQQGHHLIRFSVPEPERMVRLLCKLITSSGNDYLQSLFEGEPVDPLIKMFVRLLMIPNSCRWLISGLLKNLCPQLSVVFAAYVSNLKDLRLADEQRDEYREKFIDYWKELRIDGLICPTLPVPAVQHQYLAKMLTVAVYTALYNLLDFPAGVVPAGNVSAQDDEDLLNDSKFPIGYNPVLKTIREAAANSEGMPLSVQVVTLPYEEETCLRIMREVEKVWKEDYRKSEQVQVQVPPE
ncbi:Amidase [Oesophagostomum dentatum]|uniref:Amidase n=1 Tax=Oesophagostomum dentatum TaxID=61180 RepID=A0A0B1THY9_OESDE|nr:Amidase [Oesophagostomum dentatum]